MMTFRYHFLWVLIPLGTFSQPAQASFHLMQIEQVIGGVNGDTTAQAIQLRMRSGFQVLISDAKIVTYDASGLNPIIVITFPNNVSNSTLGDRILVATSSFITQTSPTTLPDFIMTNAIPISYQPAGSLTFEDSFGTIYWRLSWGGTNYTGSTLASTFNDLDGDFGPAFNGPLPSCGTQALLFQGSASAPSTTNEMDYALTLGPAVFTNNLSNSFTISATFADCNENGLADTCEILMNGDFNGDGTVNLLDFSFFVDCMNGPASAPTPMFPECADTCFTVFDFILDGKLDLTDLAALTLEMSNNGP